MEEIRNKITAHEAIKQSFFCDKHNTNYKHACPSCKKEDEDRKQDDSKVKKLLDVSGLDKRKMESTFENFDKSRALDQYNFCQSFATNWEKSFSNGQSIFMIGSIGGGKTHLASAIANKVIRDHYATVRYINFSLLAIKVRDAQNTRQSVEDTISQFEKCQLLIIDEIGLKGATDFEFSLINQIFDARYGWELPTILITNMNWSEVKKTIGERFESRNIQTGKSLRFNNQDYRKIIAKGV